MTTHVLCDYCGKPIVGDYHATVKFLGLWETVGLVSDEDKHYHSGNPNRPEASCYILAFNLIDSEPDPERVALEAIPVMSGRERVEIERGRREGTPLESLQIGRTSVNKLESCDVFTIEELVALTEGHLHAVPGFGPKRVDLIKDALGARGLSLCPAATYSS